jgi:hypothetical protein
MNIVEPVGPVFTAESLVDDCKANLREEIISRVSVHFVKDTQQFVMLLSVFRS